MSTSFLARAVVFGMLGLAAPAARGGGRSEEEKVLEVFNAEHPLPPHAVKGSAAVAAAFARMLKGGE